MKIKSLDGEKKKQENHKGEEKKEKQLLCKNYTFKKK